ncbi:MAG: hypothetical protein ABID54_08200 [Pseudomonadota bacterium]
MKKDSFTIIVMRQVGKIRSFEIQTKRFLVIVIVLACSILASMYFTYGYFALFQERALLLKDIQKLELDITYMDSKMKENEDFKDWSSKILSTLLNSIEMRPSAAVSKPRSPSVSASGGESKIATLLSSEVSIGDLAVGTDELDPESIVVTFTIINNNEDHRLTSGYITVVAQNEAINPPIYRASPNAEIRDGIPTNYKNGQYFAIRYLKPLKGRIKKPKGGVEFKDIVIYVYSAEGKPLLKKSFKIKT